MLTKSWMGRGGDVTSSQVMIVQPTHAGLSQKSNVVREQRSMQTTRVP